MTEITKKISLGRNLARRLLPVAAGVWLLITLGFPSIYFVLETRSLQQSSLIMAEDLTEHLTKVIVESPEFWKYQSTKILEVFQNFIPRRNLVSIAIYDESSALVTSYHGRNISPPIRFIKSPVATAPIVFNNHVVGNVQVSMSARDLFDTTVNIFIGFALLGAGLGSLLYFYPVLVVKNMEQQIKSLVGALRNSGNESEQLRVLAEHSEKRFRELIQGVEAVLWEADALTLNFSFVSNRVEHILGYTAEDCLQPGFFAKHIHPDDREAVFQMLLSIRELGRSYEFDYRIVAADNQIVWIRDKVSLIGSGDETGRQLQGLMVDITERRKISESLAEEKELLSITLRNIQDAVITTDTQGGVILMNKIAEDLTGWRQQEAIGQKISDVFRIRDEKRGGTIVISISGILERRPLLEENTSKLLATRNGTERLVDEISTVVYDSEGEPLGIVVVFRDITERRKTEEELLKIQKLESIGLLAGGIAHDFNNILTSVIGNLSIAKMYSEMDRKVRERLEDAQKACLRAQDLTTQLLTFSKGGEPVKKLCALPEILKDSANFALRGSSVNCKFFLPQNLMPVEVDVGQISQVFNNIFINAAQAMPSGGNIEIFGENTSVKSHDVPLKPRDYVKISIRDFGVGISPEYLPKIFDPYFTTKQKGSGLGLATTYSIINKHNGYITAESRQNSGATFHIYLPASNKEIAEAGEAEKRLFTGKGRILVMDDEDIVRMIISNMLDELGYQAEFAENGEQAIELFRRSLEEGLHFDAAIIDVTVRGGMGGADCIRNLIDLDAGIKAIVSSGYSDDLTLANFRELGFKNVITKPYRIEDLSEILYKTIHDINFPSY